MFDARPMILDYKANIPLHMLEAKYKKPIHEIIKILHVVSVKRPRMLLDAIQGRPPVSIGRNKSKRKNR